MTSFFCTASILLVEETSRAAERAYLGSYIDFAVTGNAYIMMWEGKIGSSFAYMRWSVSWQKSERAEGGGKNEGSTAAFRRHCFQYPSSGSESRDILDHLRAKT